jgi:hypothetical protein
VSIAPLAIGGKVEDHLTLTQTPMHIREVVARRSDLSTFLVHLTRDLTGSHAKDNLKAILAAGRIEARTVYGMARGKLEQAGVAPDSQKCVCFTETPLEYVHLLLHEIENRQVNFRPYGIAFPKKLGRQRGANPVWYIDMTPGHDFLTNPVNAMIDAAVQANDFDAAPVYRIAPFFEQMGTHGELGQPGAYRKEFWWEREWRHVGHYYLFHRVIVLCPEDEIPEFEAHIDANELNAPLAAYLDPRWGLEQIIARLAGFGAPQTDIL